jgi:hypothetical protein
VTRPLMMRNAALIIIIFATATTVRKKQPSGRCPTMVGSPAVHDEQDI